MRYILNGFGFGFGFKSIRVEMSRTYIIDSPDTAEAQHRHAIEGAAKSSRKPGTRHCDHLQTEREKDVPWCSEVQ